ncbi:MAG: anti-sigma regulatory factor [Candidatus Dormiibacterota bacterium]
MLFPITHDPDIVVTRQTGRQLAQEMGFTPVEATMIATAISEVARNILIYAGTGEVLIEEAEQDGRRGLRVVARDEGPGISDVSKALQDGFSTGAGLGLGLPGARRLMDELDLSSAPGRGTTVTMARWVRG